MIFIWIFQWFKQVYRMALGYCLYVLVGKQPTLFIYERLLMSVFDFLPCISGYWYGPNRCYFSFQSKPLLASSWPSWTCLSWCKGLQGIETRLAKSLLSRRRSIAPNAGMYSLSHLVAHDIYCKKGKTKCHEIFSWLLQKFDEAANCFYEGVQLDPESKELVDAFRLVSISFQVHSFQFFSS